MTELKTHRLVSVPEGLSLVPHIPEVWDNSTVSTWTRCPRKGFYEYGLSRSPVGVNYPIQWGVGYHKFREVLESLYKKVVVDGGALLGEPDIQSFIYNGAWNAAIVAEGKWEEPDAEHKHSYLTKARLARACEEAFESWLEEKRDDKIQVLLFEQPFDLILPNSTYRYGGRFDQLVDWDGKLWIRDFKTTSRMGKGYSLRFDPNNQMTGYVWGAQELSGRNVEGVIVEVVYNTKTKGPDFFPFLSTRTAEQVRQWLRGIVWEIGEIERQLSAGVFPMRTEACDDWGGCFFRDACRRDGWASIQMWLESNTVESIWDFMDPGSEEGVVD